MTEKKKKRISPDEFKEIEKGLKEGSRLVTKELLYRCLLTEGKFEGAKEKFRKIMVDVLFMIGDENSDGQLDFDELKQLAGCSLQIEEVVMMRKMMDVNKDGFVDLGEAKRVAPKKLHGEIENKFKKYSDDGKLDFDQFCLMFLKEKKKK